MKQTTRASFTLVDIVDGMTWQGEHPDAPLNPQLGWVYHNTTNGISWIYDGTDWKVFAQGKDADANYSIDLSNDNAIVGADYEGVVSEGILAQIASTTATVWLGNIDITSNCEFNWAVIGGTRKEQESGNTFSFSTINQDTATATVSVTYKEPEVEPIYVGSKVFKVTKQKAGKPGDSAISYKLVPNPTSWNSSDQASITPTFTVLRYEGSEVESITLGNNDGDYLLKKGAENWVFGNSISETTTFNLYLAVGNKLIDSETITAVGDGQGYTNLIIEASDYAFKKSKSGATTPRTITLTAKLYGDLQGQEEKVEWYQVQESGSIKTQTTGQTFEVQSGAITNSGTYEARLKINETIWNDIITVYKLYDGTDGTNGVDGAGGISAFLTEPHISFSADKDGKVPGGVVKKIGVKVFKGTSQLTIATLGYYDSDFIDNFNINVDKGYFELETKEDNTIGGTNLYADGQQSLVITYYLSGNSGDTNTITLSFSWDKNSVGADGIQGKDGPKGDSKTTVYAYFYMVPSDTRPLTPSAPSDETIDQWSFTDGGASPTYPYVYRSEGVQTVTSDNAITYGEWQTPILYKVHNGYSVDQQTYAEFLKITNFDTQGLYYKNDGKLYINAEMIKTGTLMVGTASNPIFSAVFNGTPTVFLGGWTANKDSLHTEDNALYLGTVGIKESIIGGVTRKDLVFKAGDNFGVTSNGTLYANQATIRGTINATSGSFSNITLGENDYGNIYTSKLSLGDQGTIKNQLVNKTTTTYADYDTTSFSDPFFTGTDLASAQQAVKKYNFYKLSNSGYYSKQITQFTSGNPAYIAQAKESYISNGHLFTNSAEIGGMKFDKDGIWQSGNNYRLHLSSTGIWTRDPNSTDIYSNIEHYLFQISTDADTLGIGAYNGNLSTGEHGYNKIYVGYSQTNGYLIGNWHVKGNLYADDTNTYKGLTGALWINTDAFTGRWIYFKNGILVKTGTATKESGWTEL